MYEQVLNIRDFFILYNEIYKSYSIGFIIFGFFVNTVIT